jgi:hypothetical protein
MGRLLVTAFVPLDGGVQALSGPDEHRESCTALPE